MVTAQTTKLARLRSMVRKCRRRGGDCPCDGDCKADVTLQFEEDRARVEAEKAQRELSEIRRQLETPLAKLRDDFVLDPDKRYVLCFDGDGASFGWMDDDDEWHEIDDWPFEQEYVWPEDCTRNGIAVEHV